MTTYSSILAEKSHGQRRLASYSLQCCKESEVTQHGHMHIYTYIPYHQSDVFVYELYTVNFLRGLVGKTMNSNSIWHSIETSKISTKSILQTHLLLLLSRFSHVQSCATPQTAAHQDPPSLGFSRPEHWSGLPFPSPMHETSICKIDGLWEFAV